MKHKTRNSVFISMVLKNLLFIALMYSFYANKLDGISLDVLLSPVHILMIIMVLAPYLCFKGKAQDKYLLIILCCYSFLLVLDLWYYRANWSFYGIRFIFFKDLFNAFHRNLINIRVIDILFVIDLPFVLWFTINGWNHNKIEKKAKRMTSILIIIAGSIILAFFHYLIDIENVTKGELDLFKTYWAPHRSMIAMSPLGYHAYEVVDTLQKIHVSENQKDINEIQDWIKDNKEDIDNNQYFGEFKGKNIIFVQLESFENFVINEKVYGQEITPFLNKLVKESIYFPNFYEQNNGGNSIDCDMMVNASMLTLGDKITFLTDAEKKYNSLPRVLSPLGYTSVSTRAERGSDWNWGEAHNNALGFKEKWDLSLYNEDEHVGFGLSDKSFYRQFREKLNHLNKPFYSVIATLSNHGPFDIDNKHRKLSLPDELNKNYLGGYFQSVNYSDEQLKGFIEDLDRDGLLDDTVIVIYGDHSGVHKYYNEKIQNVNLQGDWWKSYDHKIPLIIYSKGIKGEVKETHGGQIDIFPTIASLVGVDKKEYENSTMGRNLLNTKRDATITKGDIIYGNVKNEGEKEHLLKSYDIARKIILNNYFKERR